MNGGDQEFASYLEDCGDGKLQIEANLGPFKVKVPIDKWISVVISIIYVIGYSMTFNQISRILHG